MLPFGNLTVYFSFPEWFDDWKGSWREEKEDDPPDVKALKVRCSFLFRCSSLCCFSRFRR